MPRYSRKKGETGIYHVICRGNERKNIFNDGNYKNKFIEILTRNKERYNFIVYAYCIMDNHVHILLNENGSDISQIMKSINLSFAIYYNRINERIGHLFQDRFKSEFVDDDIYFLQVLRYIHQNPVKAGIVSSADKYPWSSYNIYVSEENSNEIIDMNFVLGMMASGKKRAIREFVSFHKKEDEKNQYMDVEEDMEQTNLEDPKVIKTIEEAREFLNKLLESKEMDFDEMLLDKNARNELIKIVRGNSVLALKELGELFGGLNYSWVSRLLKK
ncbi:MAG: transposase [Clostridiales bacterium]|nr:transposase [Clostridiales bacterium]